MNKWDILIWGILLGIVLAIAGYKFLKCRKMKKILKRAKAGEKKAVAFLERAGYRVIEVQSRKKVITTIGGTDHESTVIADLIVRKGFFKYVVEVKTQGQAFPTLPNVRRQMMEYYLVFQPHGVIFLDMDKEKMRLVKFKCAYQRKNVILQSIVCFILGIIAVTAYYEWIF
ncbi:MAG: hypothetical protein DBX41_01150 [Clostridiales bacterium]|nr:MAG: hypothetical protein DBX41_01150 [Clostridiales bacterium]